MTRPRPLEAAPGATTIDGSPGLSSATSTTIRSHRHESETVKPLRPWTTALAANSPTTRPRSMKSQPHSWTTDIAKRRAVPTWLRLDPKRWLLSQLTTSHAPFDPPTARKPTAAPSGCAALQAVLPFRLCCPSGCAAPQAVLPLRRCCPSPGTLRRPVVQQVADVPEAFMAPATVELAVTPGGLTHAADRSRAHGHAPPDRSSGLSSRTIPFCCALNRAGSRVALSESFLRRATVGPVPAHGSGSLLGLDSGPGGRVDRVNPPHRAGAGTAQHGGPAPWAAELRRHSVDAAARAGTRLACPVVGLGRA